MEQADALTGRVAVVTGSTRGLGFAMARLLGVHGAAVVLASRSDADVAAAVGQLRAEGVTASGLRCDTADWVTFSRCAARSKPPSSTIAARHSSAAVS